jgi:vacuolar iron transporter family protein
MQEKTFKKAVQTEVDTSYLYKRISELEKDPQISSFYSEMARIEMMHADKIKLRAESEGLRVELAGPSLRAKALGWIAKTMGYNLILGVLMDTEKGISAATIQKKQNGGKTIEGNEARHVNILKSLSQLSGEKIGKIEGRHRSVGGNALRAAVLGANDGLVSNMSLVMGVAGATAGGKEVLIAGIAGLLAGAISMALGEWISVKSSQELYERQMEIEMEEIENNPEEEKQELILLYKAKGFTVEEAAAMAKSAFSDKSNTHSILIKEELGINPEELKGSAWEAAIASFILFVVGAIIPLAPFFFLTGTRAIIISVIASTIGLFFIGAGITLVTGKSFVRSGLRQVVFGLLAAAVTFTIGKLIGTSITG